MGRIIRILIDVVSFLVRAGRGPPLQRGWGPRPSVLLQRNGSNGLWRRGIEGLHIEPCSQRRQRKGYINLAVPRGAERARGGPALAGRFCWRWGSRCITLAEAQRRASGVFRGVNIRARWRGSRREVCQRRFYWSSSCLSSDAFSFFVLCLILHSTSTLCGWLLISFQCLSLMFTMNGIVPKWWV